MSVLVSVVVPVYNAQDVLADTLGNLVYQTLYERYGEGALEVLLIDDLSTDDTGAILDDLHRQFPQRIKVCHLEEHLGPGGARNAGMDLAGGLYVGFADCDDIVDVSCYEKLYECATQGGYLYDYVDSPVYFEDSGESLLVTPPEYAGALDAEKKSNLLSEIGYLFTRLIRKDFLDANGLRTREHVTSEDEDFLAEIVCRATSVNVLTEPLYVRRSSKKKKLGPEVNDMMKPFGTLVSSAISAFGRLSALPDYEAFRAGAEAFYLKRIARALQLYDTYHKAGLIEEEMDAQILSTVRRTAETVAVTPFDENPFVMQVFSLKDIRRLEKYL